MFKNVPFLIEQNELNSQTDFQKKINLKKCIKALYIYLMIYILMISVKVAFKKTLVYIDDYPNSKNPMKKVDKITNMKIALCTIGKQENLYAKEFIEYYINLGVDHIYIYDDNDPNTERIADIVEPKYKSQVTIHLTKDKKVTHQSMAFDNCYKSYNKEYDWFIILDMDEFLYIRNNTLENYLLDHSLDKCDIVKINWVVSRDNDLLHYDPRPQFERFKPPYIKSNFIKSVVRGNISDLGYWVHSPWLSPKRNITCDNRGERIFYKDLNFEKTEQINIDKAFIVHFRFRSTEELIIKNKRGFGDWLKDDLEWTLNAHILDYFQQNTITLEKINYIEKELKVNLWKYRLKYFFQKLFYLDFIHI